MSRPATLLGIVAVIEGATGVSLVLAPGMMLWLLFASDLEGTGLSVTRIAGIALSGFALACWIASRNGELNAVLAGMLFYNALVGVYFVFIAVTAIDVGPMLWPAAALHVVFTALLASAFRSQIGAP